MNSNERLIHQFYTAFQARDYKTMQQCYADNAKFSDPVFHDLDAQHVRAMWEMFCQKSKDMKIEFRNVKANDTEGGAEWTAWYTFSSTNKKVVNHISANFLFENGKIVRHTDHFSFYNWAKQALGLSGLLLGWLPFVRNKAQKFGMKALNDYMKQKGEKSSASQ